MLKLKQNHTPRDVKVLTDQLVDAVASAGGGSSASPYMATVLTSASAGAAQTALGMSDFAKTLLDDPDSPTALSTLGFTATGVALATAASASTALTALGVSPFAKTLLDDTDAASARTTLGALAQTTWDNRKSFVPKNLIDNGDFYWWRVSTTQTNNGFGSADRWHNKHVGSTKTTSRQAFTTGQTDVPGFPLYFARTVVASVAGASNHVAMRQPINYVKTLAGKKATLTFYAKADANRSIASEFVQFFGAGTGTSSPVTGIEVRKWNLTTAWQKCQVVVTIPSMTGKTIGFNDWDTLDLNIWFDAGSSFNSRTISLGQQSGTFDIAHISLVEGDTTDEVDAFFPKPYEDDLQTVMSYYQYNNSISHSSYSAAANGTFNFNFSFPRAMVSAPSAFFYNTTYSNANTVGTVTTISTNHVISFRVTTAGIGTLTTGVEYYALIWGYNW